MDSPTKSAIKQLVLDLRHTLEDEIEIALKRYGIFTDRKWPLDEAPERLSDEAEREAWQRIVAEIRRSMKEGRSQAEATCDYARESGFTFLNRLVGLKCLEVRGIIDEIITIRDIYGGRSRAHRDYRDEHPREARGADDALPAALQATMRHVNDTLIGYLFDPDDDHSLVWPRYAVLKTCIEKINALDESVWREDEIIGWIYQFYNAEEKVAVRKRGKPQTPHEVAVINQFFTPRWIVKFLVDNTLGRLWLEMHPDSPRVRAKCDYLVPELLPDDTDQESSSGESEPSSNPKLRLDPDSPINNPHAAPRREEKPVTEIRLLDPAGGTMHFGHYAMEVFQAMYQDSRERGETEIADERIPGAILENNLFGVDIDPRAVQLAALSLFMKARTLHPEARVRQVNLVVADATMPDSGVKKRFLARYAHDKRLQQAVAQVLDDLDQVAQVGSLLRVEERLRELLARAGHAAAAAEGFDTRHQHELPGMEPAARQMGLSEVATEDQITPWTPHTTLQEVRDELRAFARQALEEHDVNAQLFATEADKAVRLLDVLVGKYDIVVMNPPYGDTSESAQAYLDRVYSHTAINLYAAFIERCLDFMTARGFCGALVSRTFLVQPQFTELRRNILLHRAPPVHTIDLGFGILDDATVDTCATVLELLGDTTSGEANSHFYRVDATEQHEQRFLEILYSLTEQEPSQRYFARKIRSLRNLPDCRFFYWAPARVAELFERAPKLDPSTAQVRQGMSSGDDKQFLRQRWEINEHQIGEGKKWVAFAKGGEYGKYYADLDLLIYWQDDGKQIKETARKKYGSVTRTIKNQAYYFREGITYPNSSSIGFSARYMPVGAIISVKGQGIYTRPEDQWWLLGLLNSQFLCDLLDIIHPGKDYQAGDVKMLPVVPIAARDREFMSHTAEDAHTLKLEWDTGNEISSFFTAPWLLEARRSALLPGFRDPISPIGSDESLNGLLAHLSKVEQAADTHLQVLQETLDESVYAIYDIKSSDRVLLRRELGNRPLEKVWTEFAGKSDQEKRREHVRRLFSYSALQAVREDEDGIVPLAGHAPRERYLIDRVRARLEAEFGAEAAYQLEQDSASYLGRSVEEWLHRYFFRQFHVGLYKNRPILWHLTSRGGYFAVLVDYHKLTRDTLPKVQSLYLWPQMEAVRSRLAAAKTGKATLKAVADLEAELADLEDCNGRLEQVIQGTVPVTLPDWARGPYRGGRPPYDPDPDDGVAVNLLPIQEAGLLPMKKVV